MTAHGKGLPKWARVAAAVRGQIADGTLAPGQPAPSGAALSRLTGFSTLTCRRALRALVADGVLVPGPSRNARPRVGGGPRPRAERDLATTARALSAGLAARRRATALTQPELARLACVSVTTIGHAETGRLWQSRRFWDRVDAVLGAHGELLRLHDAYREAAAASGVAAVVITRTSGLAGGTGVAGRAAGDAAGAGVMAEAGVGGATDMAGRVNVAGGVNVAGRVDVAGAAGDRAPGELATPGGAAGFAPDGHVGAMPASVTIVWGNGTVTTVHPPESS